MKSVLPWTRGTKRAALTELLNQWCYWNYWSPQHFSNLTREYCAPSRFLNPKDISSILQGSKPELMPKHFQAFAAVERGLKSYRSEHFTILTESQLIQAFTRSICTDDSALSASWWFAVYCEEEWALEKIVEFNENPIPSLNELGRILPGRIRSQIARTGTDPVNYLREHSQSLRTITRTLSAIHFIDWALDYRPLDEKRLRLAVPYSLWMLESTGCRISNMSNILKPIKD